MTPPTPAAALAAALERAVEQCDREIDKDTNSQQWRNGAHWATSHLQAAFTVALAASGWQVTAIEQAGSPGGASAGTESSPVSTTPPDTLRDEGLRAALDTFFEDVDADWFNDNLPPASFAFRFRAAADRLRAALGESKDA